MGSGRHSVPDRLPICRERDKGEYEMSDKQILERAIHKAGAQYEVEERDGIPFVLIQAISQIHYAPYQVLIFNHDFAKALWDKPIQGYANVYRSYELNGRDIENWQYHLAEMAIADDPIKYLGEHM